MPQDMPQDQRSLTDQLKALIPVANRQGLYDAADFLRGIVERTEAAERTVDPMFVQLGQALIGDEDAEAAHKADEDRGDYLDRKLGGR